MGRMWCSFYRQGSVDSKTGRTRRAAIDPAGNGGGVSSRKARPEQPTGSGEVSRIPNGSGSASASCGCTCISQEP